MTDASPPHPPPPVPIANSHFIAPNPIRNLVFKGGSVKGIAYVGALAALDSETGLNLLNQVENVAGTSAGAITALLIALGYNTNELFDLLVELDIETFLDDNASKFKRGDLEKVQERGSSSNASAAYRAYKDLKGRLGVFKTAKIEQWLGKLIADKTWDVIFKVVSVPDGIDEEGKRNIATNLTFGELLKLKELCKAKGLKNLFVHAFNLNRQECTCFSATGPHRDTIILDAVLASLSIPLVYEPHQIYKRRLTKGQEGSSPQSNKIKLSGFEEDLFIDGGIVNNYPTNTFAPAPNDTLGFFLATPADVAAIVRPEGAEPPRDNIEGLAQFGRSIADTLLNYFQLQEHLRGGDRVRTIYIPTGDIGLLDFKLTGVQKNWLIQSGWEAVHAAIGGQETLTLVPDQFRLSEERVTVASRLKCTLS